MWGGWWCWGLTLHRWLRVESLLPPSPQHPRTGATITNCLHANQCRLLLCECEGVCVLVSVCLCVCVCACLCVSASLYTVHDMQQYFRFNTHKTQTTYRLLPSFLSAAMAQADAVLHINFQSIAISTLAPISV